MMETSKQEKPQDTHNLLVVDDEAVIREGMRRILSTDGYHVETSASGRAAIEKIQEQDFDVVITDLKMPGMDGIEVLKTIKILQPEVPVIIITGYSTVDTAVDAMKNGAFDYIAKPFTSDLILDKVRKAIAQKELVVDSFSVKKVLSAGHGFEDFVGESMEMQKVYRRIMQVAPTDSTVLITGESGTGKELVARAVHKNSPRHDQPFVAVDCTSLPETLLESELFGHVKGSFTGAIHSKTGLFKVADGGTLFLDEISNISLATQAKLLRVLQERMLTPIGDTRPVPIDIRLVVATNINLRAMVDKGSFREDLFFRINVIPINLPPLTGEERGPAASHSSLPEEVLRRGGQGSPRPGARRHGGPGGIRVSRAMFGSWRILSNGRSCSARATSFRRPTWRCAPRMKNDITIRISFP